MGGLFTMLFAKVAAVVQWFADLFVAVFKALSDMLSDVLAWAFEQVMEVAESAIGVLDFSAISGYLSTFDAIPAGVLEVLAASGVGAGLSIVGAALLVRMGLQLIPFVRLGS